MEAQTVIDTALSANAITLGSAAAAEIFREKYKSTPKVSVNLTPGQRQLVEKSINFPVVFTGGKNVTNDPVLVAFRDLARHIFETEHKISQSKERVLIVGAAMREITQYNSNPHIHYYVYGKENKDYDRIVRPALRAISDGLRKKASKKNNSVFIVPGCGETKTRPCVKRYENAQQVLQDYVILNKLPGTIHTTLIECNTLVLEDSFYNFGERDWIDLFDRTGAQVAYGYGLLPLELLYPDLPENPLYRIRVNNCAGTTSLVFTNGYCNGYVHKTKNWKTLITSPIIAVPGRKTVLAVEITSRIGPAVVFKVYKCTNKEIIVRSIDLSPADSYVKVLDVRSTVDLRTGRVKFPLKYISVREDEYMDICNYSLSLDVKSLTFPNIVSYIRRRMGGLSLITKELVAPWYIQKNYSNHDTVRNSYQT